LEKVKKRTTRGEGERRRLLERIKGDNYRGEVKGEN
jgi:hypothetical protein